MRKFILYTLGILLFVSQFARIFSSKTHMQNQSVLLVTAHPDDETMFFGPTLRHVLDPRKNNSVHLLVLSNGNSEGLGQLREAEMHNASLRIGLNPANLAVVDDSRLPDSMEAEWDQAVVAEHVAQHIERWQPQTVITFDEHGVSGHANHKAVHGGVLAASVSRAAAERDFTMLTLYSVPLWRKYLFSVDSVLTKLTRNLAVQYNVIMGSLDYHHITAALNCHRSQITWYRRLWSFFSRYMLVNDLGEVNFGRALRSDTFKGEAKAKVLEAWENRERGQNFQTLVHKPKPTKARSHASQQPSREITRQKPFTVLPVVETAPGQQKQDQHDQIQHEKIQPVHEEL